MVDPRWRAVLAVAPYLVLLVLVAFAVGTEWGALPALLPDLVLCAVYAAWILLLRTARSRWRSHPAAITVFLAGVILLNLVLVLRHGWFGFLAVATFTFAFSLASWPWELLAVGATAVVAGIAQSSGFGDDVAGVVGTVVVVTLNVVVMCGMSWGLRLASQQTERAGVEAERARLAREIHDTLAQGFAGVVTQLQAADVAPDAAARRRHTDAAIGLAREGLAEARRSVSALRPAALDERRLPEALGAVAARWADRTGIAVDVRVSGADRHLRTETEVALLRTAQEALANVERHAGATRVVVTLHRDRRSARLEVRDDGCGFDPSAPRVADGDGGFGLTAMRERLQAVAGELVVESSRGSGTAIRAEVPA